MLKIHNAVQDTLRLCAGLDLFDVSGDGRKRLLSSSFST